MSEKTSPMKDCMQEIKNKIAELFNKNISNKEQSDFLKESPLKNFEWEKRESSPMNNPTGLSPKFPHHSDSEQDKVPESWDTISDSDGDFSSINSKLELRKLTVSKRRNSNSKSRKSSSKDILPILTMTHHLNSKRGKNSNGDNRQPTTFAIHLYVSNFHLKSEIWIEGISTSIGSASIRSLDGKNFLEIIATFEHSKIGEWELKKISEKDIKISSKSYEVQLTVNKDSKENLIIIKNAADTYFKSAIIKNYKNAFETALKGKKCELVTKLNSMIEAKTKDTASNTIHETQSKKATSFQIQTTHFRNQYKKRNNCIYKSRSLN